MALTDKLTAIADAIRAKDGSTTPMTLDEMPGKIAAITTGGGSSAVSLGDVNFYDYDGTLLHSYTIEEAQALTALPELPTHDGLICQGWNYTLDQIKAENAAVNVGTMYITDDGKTRIYIHLEDGRLSPMLGFGVNGTVTVDWGDGNTSTLTGTSVSTAVFADNHTYASAGDYVIKLEVDGSAAFLGNTSVGSYLLCYTNTADKRNKVYSNAIQKVEIGSNVINIGSSAFYNCYSLSSITIPSGVTSIESNAFYSCYSLSSITIPSGVTRIRNYAFYNCYSLLSITIPSGVTSIENYAFYSCYSLSSIAIPSGATRIGSSAFYNCYSLSSITIPSGVTSIESNAFYSCSSVAYYDFSNHTSVPTLSSTNSFTGIAADCEIRVPVSLADEWKAATNWSTYADYIVGV